MLCWWTPTWVRQGPGSGQWSARHEAVLGQAAGGAVLLVALLWCTPAWVGQASGPCRLLGPSRAARHPRQPNCTNPKLLPSHPPRLPSLTGGCTPASPTRMARASRTTHQPDSPPHPLPCPPLPSLLRPPDFGKVARATAGFTGAELMNLMNQSGEQGGREAKQNRGGQRWAGGGRGGQVKAGEEGWGRA